jgi:ribosomal protein S1
MNNDLAWDSLKQTLRVGTKLRGNVTHHAPYGIFVDIKGIPFPGLVQITEFKDSGRMTSEEYPSVGSVVVVVVLGFKDHEKQIWLGMKPSQLCHRKEDTNSGEGLG